MSDAGHTSFVSTTGIISMERDIKISGLNNIIPVSNTEGTVYSARRTAEIETIVKVLPQPVNLDKKDDAATVTFLKETKKLKHINQVSNLHVIKILNLGLTEADHFPFIETEMVKGPKLDDLLVFPNNPVFEIEDVISLARQMADALAHCHTALVKHGDINSKNIRLNSETGNYVLLNFGCILFSPEARAYRYQATVDTEYLAPEQADGQLLFETDVYSLGMVLYQALTGSLPPFKNLERKDSGQVQAFSADFDAAQVKTLRGENLPPAWLDSKKEFETNIPAWLLEIISRCLEADPAKRYANGIKLQDALLKAHENENARLAVAAFPAIHPPAIAVANSALLPATIVEKDLEIKRLNNVILQKDGQLDVFKYQSAEFNPQHNSLSISKPVFFSMLALVAGLGAVSVYGFFFRTPEPRNLATTYFDSEDSTQYNPAVADTDSSEMLDTAALLRSMPPIAEEKSEINNADEDQTIPEPEKPQPKPNRLTPIKKTSSQNNERNTAERDQSAKREPADFEAKPNRPPKYTLAVPKAYFYDEPDVRSRRPVYLANSNESELTATEDSNGFIYVVFFNTEREITRGWLRKQDLRKIN